MSSRAFSIYLTQLGVRFPRSVLTIAAVMYAFMILFCLRVTNEVGFSAYFGPDHSEIVHFKEYLKEFNSGMHILLAFSCEETERCESVVDESALSLLGRLQHDLNQINHVYRTTSVLNSPIVTAPLTAKSIANYDQDQGYKLAVDWKDLVDRLSENPFVKDSLLSENGITTGMIIELASLESIPLRESVLTIRDLASSYEAELGAEIFLAGDPIWTVVSADELNSDTGILSILMLLVILAVLYSIFRSMWLTVFPILIAQFVAVLVVGLIGFFRIPMTVVLVALPPIMMVIAVTISIHFLTAVVRYYRDSDEIEPPEKGNAAAFAANHVGSSCYWASVTTACGFFSFVLSDLESFRNFGLLASIGIAFSYLVTFTVLPAMLVVGGKRVKASHRNRSRTILSACVYIVTHHHKSIMLVGLGLLLFLSYGMTRSFYKTDFGDHSFILRSVRFIESNLRKPLTTEIVVTIPEEKRIYSEETLVLLKRIEDHFEDDPDTGNALSFIDFLEYSYHLDRGSQPDSFSAMIGAAPDLMPILAEAEQISSFWSQSISEDEKGSFQAKDRARISIARAWLGDDRLTPHLERVHVFTSDLNRELQGSGYRVTVEGGLVLTELAITKIRDTQRDSLITAFMIVSIALLILFLKSPRVVGWGILLNVLPVSAVLGLMGWIGIGIDPANSMAGAILLVIVVDDTIHLCRGYLDRRAAGMTTTEALRSTIETVGEAVLTTSICLALGFSVLLLSHWGGLATFGLIASVGVIFALVADLLVLFAAIRISSSDESPNA